MVLTKLKQKKDAQANVITVKASSFGWNAKDSTVALQAAIDSGAQKVIVDWQDEGDWIISPVILRTSNQEIAIADGVTLRGRVDSTSHASSLLTIPEGVTNVFLHGIVTAAIAIDGGKYRHALSVYGGENVNIRDLTVVSDESEGITAVNKAKSLSIDGIVYKKPFEWPKRKK